MPRPKKRLTLALIITVIHLVCLYYFWFSPQYVVPILVYHSISDGENKSLHVSPGNFERQMGYIQWRGYNVIGLDELVEGIKNNKKFKRNTVVITFDDGSEDNYLNAYSELKKYDFPATIFLISNYVGREGYLKQYQIKEMLQEGKITFGSHTRNHSYLPDITRKNILRAEIAGSKTDIEKITGEKIDLFCYPIGGFTEEAKEMIIASGYEAACTTNRGFAKLNADVYELKRIKVKSSDLVEKPLSFWAKLTGYYNIFRKGKNPY